jgi:hypothetical protein
VALGDGSHGRRRRDRVISGIASFASLSHLFADSGDVFFERGSRGWRCQKRNSGMVRFPVAILRSRAADAWPRGRRRPIQVAGCRFSRWVEPEVWPWGADYQFLFDLVPGSSMVGLSYHLLHVWFFSLSLSTGRKIRWASACSCL